MIEQQEYNKNKGFTLTELAFSVAIMSIISVAVSTLLTASYQAQMTHRTSALVESISMNFTEQFRRDARLATVVRINGQNSNQIPPINVQIDPTIGHPLDPVRGNRIFFYYRTLPNFNNTNPILNTGLFVEYRVENGQILRRANYDPETREALLSTLETVFIGPRQGREDANGLIGRCVQLNGQGSNSGINLQNANNCFQYETTVFYNQPGMNGQILQSALTRVGIDGIQIGPDPNDPTPIVFPVDGFGRPVYNIRQTSFELGSAKVFR